MCVDRGGRHKNRRCDASFSLSFLFIAFFGGEEKKTHIFLLRKFFRSVIYVTPNETRFRVYFYSMEPSTRTTATRSRVVINPFTTTMEKRMYYFWREIGKRKWGSWLMSRRRREERKPFNFFSFVLGIVTSVRSIESAVYWSHHPSRFLWGFPPPPHTHLCSRITVMASPGLTAAAAQQKWGWNLHRIPLFIVCVCRQHSYSLFFLPPDLTANRHR